MDLERFYDMWKNSQPQAIGEPKEPLNEANPIPEPTVENKADKSEPPATEPKIAAEAPGAASEAQGFSPGLTAETRKRKQIRCCRKQRIQANTRRHAGSKA